MIEGLAEEREAQAALAVGGADADRAQAAGVRAQERGPVRAPPRHAARGMCVSQAEADDPAGVHHDHQVIRVATQVEEAADEVAPSLPGNSASRKASSPGPSSARSGRISTRSRAIRSGTPGGTTNPLTSPAMSCVGSSPR